MIDSIDVLTYCAYQGSTLRSHEGLASSMQHKWFGLVEKASVDAEALICLSSPFFGKRLRIAYDGNKGMQFIRRGVTADFLWIPQSEEASADKRRSSHRPPLTRPNLERKIPYGSASLFGKSI
jgi:hypothetical protein